MKMASVQEKFKEDIAHYSKHGLLYLESGPYDIEEKSAQELMNRHDRMTKLQKELDEMKNSWPDIFKGKLNIHLFKDFVSELPKKIQMYICNSGSSDANHDSLL